MCVCDAALYLYSAAYHVLHTAYRDPAIRKEIINKHNINFVNGVTCRTYDRSVKVLQLITYINSTCSHIRSEHRGIRAYERDWSFTRSQCAYGKLIVILITVISNVPVFIIITDQGTV